MKFFSFFSPKFKTTIKSKINKEIKITRGIFGKVVYVGEAEQTGGTITGMWKKTFDIVKKDYPDVQNTLLLGLGGGDVIRILRKNYKEINITAVEIDPVMIDVAGRFFNIKSSSFLTIVQDDAFNFLEKTTKKYDLIIVDLFIGRKNPQKFRRPSFLKLLKNHLKKKGIAVYNSHFIPRNTNEFENFGKIVSLIFPGFRVIVSYRFSRLLLFYFS